MDSAAKKLLSGVLALPSETREELILKVSDSLEPVGLSPEWEVEIQRRVHALTQGTALTSGSLEVLDDLLARYPE